MLRHDLSEGYSRREPLWGEVGPDAVLFRLSHDFWASVIHLMIFQLFFNQLLHLWFLSCFSAGSKARLGAARSNLLLASWCVWREISSCYAKYKTFTGLKISGHVLASVLSSVEQKVSRRMSALFSWRRKKKRKREKKKDVSLGSSLEKKGCVL